MPRRNRVDPWGDLHAVDSRGMFTGNRGCLVDQDGRVVRHHRGSLWIACLTTVKEWKAPLACSNRWTPLFFLDDAVALAAGHRPCGLCRRGAYISYRDAVATWSKQPVTAPGLNRRLAAERLNRGRGIDRAMNRRLWQTSIDLLPVGAVFVGPDRAPQLVLADHVRAFTFDGWGAPVERPRSTYVQVLTPLTSVAALTHGYEPVLHPTASVKSRTGAEKEEPFSDSRSRSRG